jgi:hypothetical protein
MKLTAYYYLPSGKRSFGSTTCCDDENEQISDHTDLPEQLSLINIQATKEIGLFWKSSHRADIILVVAMHLFLSK